jgi:hypothetical protein
MKNGIDCGAYYNAATGKLLCIGFESYPNSPREWDNLTEMICYHPRYNLGDKHNYSDVEAKRLEQEYGLRLSGSKVLYQPSNYNDNRDLLTAAEYWKLPKTGKMNGYRDYIAGRDDYEIREDSGILFLGRLYLYDHSGVTIWLSGYQRGYIPSDGWDTSCVGFAVIFKDRARELCGEEYIRTKPPVWWEEQAKGEVRTYDDYLRGEVFYFTLYDCATDEEDSCGGFYGDSLDDLLGTAGITAAEFAEQFTELPVPRKADGSFDFDKARESAIDMFHNAERSKAEETQLV